MISERLLFIGIGQCGNNIVREFEELGFNSFYINTSSEDLLQIDTEISLKYNIPNSGGCAKDRQLAKKYTAKYYNEMMNTIDDKFSTSDIRFVVYSLGGGTGGGISNILLEIMSKAHPDIIYNVIAVLPDEHETMLIQKNAFDSLKELNSIENVHAIHLLDNNNVVDKMDINTQIAMLIESVTKANNSDKNGCFDSIEIERCITQKGFSVILEIESEDDPKIAVANAIKESIYATWINDCKTLGYTINTRKRSEEVALKEALFENFGTPYVDFTGFDSNATSNIIIASGIGFNGDLLNVLGDRYTALKEKKKNEIKDISYNEVELEDIEISVTKTIKTKARKEDINKQIDDIFAKYGMN